MGKAGKNETRKITAQYLNGIAIAVLVSGTVGQFLNSDGRLEIVLLTGTASLTLHALARRIVRSVED